VKVDDSKPLSISNDLKSRLSEPSIYLKRNRIENKLLLLNKECLKLRVQVLKIERELARPYEILKFIDPKNRAPRALEKHKLPDELRLKSRLKETN